MVAHQPLLHIVQKCTALPVEAKSEMGTVVAESHNPAVDPERYTLRRIPEGVGVLESHRVTALGQVLPVETRDDPAPICRDILV